MNASTVTESAAYAAPLSSGDELPYQTLSRGAIASVLLGVFGLLSFPFVALILLSVVGLGLGIAALFAIRRYPDELLGKPFALVGVALCSLTLVSAPAYHAYIYATEVPPGYTRVAFADLMSATGQEDRPTDKALEMDGKQVFLKGYIHPTSMNAPRAKSFVLVPDLGTCCFGGQPPLTHMIEITLTGDDFVTKSLRRKKLAGTLRVNRVLKPVEGLNGVFYQMKVDHIQ